jgi:endonuclease/exonuclease/phosphatase family metal-dependent hydrolase
MSKPLRIATSNLQTGIGTTRGYWHYLLTGWKYLFPHGSAPVRQAAAFLENEEIDVAALTEVEGGSWRSKGVDQAALIAEATPLRHRVFFPTFTADGRINQGNALCARSPLRGPQAHKLPGSGEPRFLCEAEARLRGTPVRVCATHLSLKRPLRTPQIERVAEIVAQRPGVPTILAGDFNVSETSELHLLVEGGLQRADAGPTFPAWAPEKTLDHLFFSEHFEILCSYTCPQPLFADHRPLVAEVELA